MTNRIGVRRGADGTVTLTLWAADGTGGRVLAPPTVYAPHDDTHLLAEALDRERLRPGADVLDVATGGGVLALAAARRGARVTAVDRAWRAVLTARLTRPLLGCTSKSGAATCWHRPPAAVTGAGPAAVFFCAEHVEADAVHEQIVRRDVIGGLLEEEPWLEEDVAFGIDATGWLEGRLGERLLTAWRAGSRV